MTPGSPPVRPRTAPPSLRPHPPPRPCVFAGRLHASIHHQHDAPASSGSASHSFCFSDTGAPLSRKRRNSSVEMTMSLALIAAIALCNTAREAQHQTAIGRCGHAPSACWRNWWTVRAARPSFSVPISRLRLTRFGVAPRLRAPSLGTTTASPPSLPRGTGRFPVGLDHFDPRLGHAPPLIGGEDEISQVPGRPLRTCPALRPRRTTSPRPASTAPLQDRRCGLPLD